MTGDQAASPPGHQDIGVLGAFIDGVNRVKRAPALIIGLWLATVLVALSLAWGPFIEPWAMLRLAALR